MQTRPASTLSHAALTQLWNRAYAGYFVSSVAFSEAQLAQHLRCGQVQLEHSLVALEGEVPVGLSLLGVRGERGWIGGFGLAPEARGRGLSQRLIEAHLAHVRTLAVPRVQLEVLTVNWAQKVYARAGFVPTRRLLVLSGPLAIPAEQTEAAVLAPPAQLLPHLARLHGDFPAAWNREAAWLECALTEHTEGLRVGPAHAPAGVALLERRPEGWRLLGAAAQDAQVARQLVATVARHCEGQPVTLVNEPEGSPLAQALLALGAREVHAQLEMHWAA